ncbi:MAG: phosphoesterase [Verrucomicrobia bacterium]|nr:MAG: phosphoesterase [Verrucomicrobiota bacterium]
MRLLGLGLIAGLFLASARSQGFYETQATVGALETNRFYTPVNQILTPAGIQTELPGLRPQALALSPDGRLLVTAGKTHELVVIDAHSAKVLQRVPLPGESSTSSESSAAVAEKILEPDKAGQLSFTGLIFSPDGSRIYLANVAGGIKVFAVGPGRNVQPLITIRLPASEAPRRKTEIPAGLALSADGKLLYVVLNLSNELAELDASTGIVRRTWRTGVAPYDVRLLGRKAYVSNWGGRQPDPNSVTGPAGHGTTVRVDSVRFIANEGSVSVIDLNESKAGAQSQTQKSIPAASEILVGLHPCAVSLSPNARWLVVANAGSDMLSVIDTRTDTVAETIWARQNPGDLFGAQPNALAFDKSGKKLFVCNGTQNAVAVIDFQPGSKTGSALAGLIPVGWFPGAIACDGRRNRLYIANIKGVASTKRLAEHQHDSAALVDSNTHEHRGTITSVPVPSLSELKTYTWQALANLRYPLLRQAAQRPRPDQPPRPVPERVGEPSVFKHVVYVIKENRSYDQVLGDIKEGNGDPALCVFGERITPNLHKLARQFVLLDNTYCCGILSADGHQWADSAFATEYVERSFAGFPRSYPDGMGDDEVDALAYSSAGFIWDNAIAHGKTFRDYGEFAFPESHWKDPAKKTRPTYKEYYDDFIQQRGEIEIRSRPGIESLRPYVATNTVGWDLRIPDVVRADRFNKELHEFEKSGSFPQLILICLPNDHTSGTRAGRPTPAAQVADNDLAFGRIVEAISQSLFWPETCVFCIEDDPQNGWDHVSGFRTTAYVASPYTRRSAVVHTQYNQTSLLRTIELILGLPPMNQMDAAATPMFDCFTNQPDFAPFVAVPNNVPLDQTNPEPKQVSDPLLRKLAVASARLPLDRPDQCPEDLLNHILWHSTKGSATPYPQWAVQSSPDRD